MALNNWRINEREDGKAKIISKDHYEDALHAVLAINQGVIFNNKKC